MTWIDDAVGEIEGKLLELREATERLAETQKAVPRVGAVRPKTFPLDAGRRVLAARLPVAYWYNNSAADHRIAAVDLLAYDQNGCLCCVPARAASTSCDRTSPATEARELATTPRRAVRALRQLDAALRWIDERVSGIERAREHLLAQQAVHVDRLRAAAQVRALGEL